MTLRAGPDIDKERRTHVVAREPSASPVPPVLPRAALTPRQRQVVAAVATGLMNKEVAYQLGIAENTVRVHLSEIYRRTGLARRGEVTRWWLGLLDDGLCPVTLGRCGLPAGHDGEHHAVFQ